MQISKLRPLSVPAYWLLAMLYWETLVHAGMYDGFHSAFFFALGFAGALGLLIGFAVSHLRGDVRFFVSLVLTLLITVVYGSQLVYCFIFGTPYSVSQMGMGGDAITSFWKETVTTIRDHFGWILALLLPAVVLIVLRVFQFMIHPELPVRIAAAVLGAALFAVSYLGILLGDHGMYSNYYFFTSTRSTTAQTMERFGVPMTFYLELTHTEEPEEAEMVVVIPETAAPPETEPNPDAPEEEIPEPTAYNVMELDFDALNASTQNAKILALNDYVSRMPGTNQNAYTGMLKDYNLIVICAESYSPAAVDPELTPTLYRLTHEGFLFRNYFNSFPNTTIDGEYTLLQGLYPDSVRGKEDSSMLASAKHILPFTLANSFAKQLGVSSWGYHNNYGSYYNRDLSHPNMGYQMKFSGRGMTFTDHWPTSDLEMMEQSIDDYIHEEQFHAYYMTFSGHYLYDPEINGIAAKNFDLVKKLPDYDMNQKAYLSCNIELDKAMEYLLQRLEEAGVADKTAIVLAGDHFPYGLYKKQYFGMIGKEEDFFEAYRSDLIFWVGGMEEPVEVETYCCNADVLPTLLNLWGIEYDSRMLAGTDIFSDGPHVAVLIDRSFLTDRVWFNSNTRETRYLVPEEEVPSDYADNMNLFIASRFDFSTQVLRTDYYRFVFGTN